MTGGCAPGQDISDNITIQNNFYQQQLPHARYCTTHGLGQGYGYPNNITGHPNNALT